jgi:hypothetical protein
MLSKIPALLALVTTLVGILSTVDWAAFGALPIFGKVGIIAAVAGSVWQAVTKPITPSGGAQ